MKIHLCHASFAGIFGIYCSILLLLRRISAAGFPKTKIFLLVDFQLQSCCPCAMIQKLASVNFSEEKDMRTIDDLTIGESGVISQVGGEGALRLRFLDMGLIPGTTVILQKIAPMGDPIQIQVRGYELTIRREDARKIVLREERV